MTTSNQSGFRGRARISPTLGGKDPRARRNAALDRQAEDFEEPVYLTPQGRIGLRTDSLLFLLDAAGLIQAPLYVTDKGKLALRLGAQMVLDSSGALTLSLDLSTDA